MRHHDFVEPLAQGWEPDSFGRHDERWMSAGYPTDLVRDAGREGHDAPTESPSSSRSPERHWIDVDRLERTTASPSPHWPLNRVPSPSPAPRQPRWQIALAVGLAFGSIFVTVAVTFGHPISPPPPLGRDETIGTVLAVGPSPANFIATYDAPGHDGPGGSDPNGIRSGLVTGTASPGSVSAGQSVVVRYDPKDTTIGTVVSLTPPHARPNGPIGWLVVGLSWSLTIWYAASRVYRRFRRLQEEEDNTDYRVDPWAGTSNSA